MNKLFPLIILIFNFTFNSICQPPPPPPPPVGISCDTSCHDMSIKFVNGLTSRIKSGDTINLRCGDTFRAAMTRTCRAYNDSVQGEIYNTNGALINYIVTSYAPTSVGLYKIIYRTYPDSLHCDSATVYLSVICPPVCDTTCRLSGAFVYSQSNRNDTVRLACGFTTPSTVPSGIYLRGGMYKLCRGGIALVSGIVRIGNNNVGVWGNHYTFTNAGSYTVTFVTRAYNSAGDSITCDSCVIPFAVVSPSITGSVSIAGRVGRFTNGDTISLEKDSLYTGGVRVYIGADSSSYLDGIVKNSSGVVISGQGYGVFQFPTSGIYTITYYLTTLDSAGHAINIDSIVIKVKVSGTSSLEKVSSSEGIKLYPNPMGSQLHIAVDKGIMTESISIADMKGREVISRKLSGSVDMNVATLTPGNYLVRISLITGELKTFTVVK